MSGWIVQPRAGRLLRVRASGRRANTGTTLTIPFVGPSERTRPSLWRGSRSRRRPFSVLETHDVYELAKRRLSFVLALITYVPRLEPNSGGLECGLEVVVYRLLV